MKLIYFLGILVCAATALPLEENHANGEEGWYVPQADGSFVWMSTEEGEELLEELEKNEIEDEEMSVDDDDETDILSSVTVPVHFYLYTNENPKKSQKIKDSAKSLKKSNFDPNNPTRFIIHGWIQNQKAHMNSNIRDALLSRGDYNIIVVDWSRARSVDYATSVSAVRPTGKKVAKIIDYLVENHGLDLHTTEVIGHSLGAHVAGYAGKNIGTGKLHAIIGLDPALPLFSYSKPKKRLSMDDAEYVETIHTNGGNLGFLKPIGKGAFYPNGGKKQPGCGWDVTGACSHGRSCEYYAEAVAANSFISVRCGDYEGAVKDSCGNQYSGVRMGSATNAYVVAGEFYVPVHNATPYGFGL
ncbi:phospholipase A1 VesT1.02-like [Eurosta solidaginis]|uniref:phospholipase A1 VesT1.02-like n=1 Tax=Eurosta solidaginis TaxID=178769 RepID=UPI003530F200